MLSINSPGGSLSKIYFSSDGRYLPGHVNITINSNFIGDLFLVSFPPHSASIIRLNNIFVLLSLPDSCFFLYSCRKWLAADGKLIIEGFGSLGNNIPLLLFQLLYASGFLTCNDRERITDPIPTGHLSASPYSLEMPEYIYLSRIKNFLNFLGRITGIGNCGEAVDYFSMFCDRLNQKKSD
jgi:hypothetical protein